MPVRKISIIPAFRRDKREKALATRQALLEAAERELDQKVRELTVLRTEIEGLMVKQTEEEKARTQSLVRIYEGMKAKDAARIFNTLDTDVLLQVMTQMSERKSSPILAEMDPERARTVTILMAQQQQLPALPPQ
jgi:flagellar motility protein MotE (MotC chaperone)